MSTGEFYELHARLHGFGRAMPAFGAKKYGSTMPMPRAARGSWKAADVSKKLKPIGKWGYLWHGSPWQAKAATGAAAAAAATGAVATGYALAREDSE